jgi:hypothetical protein
MHGELPPKQMQMTFTQKKGRLSSFLFELMRGAMWTPHFDNTGF